MDRMAPNVQMAKSHLKKDSMNLGYAILKIMGSELDAGFSSISIRECKIPDRFFSPNKTIELRLFILF